MKKKLLIALSSIFITIILIVSSIGKSYASDFDIEQLLQTDSYSSLSPVVKQFIRDYYEENGVVLLTKDLAKDGEAYLNPSYIEYLDSENKDGYYVIPSVTAYTPVFVKTRAALPSSYDLRNVNGKNFVTPNKNQGNEGLCWAYSTMSLVETHDLISKNKSYDSTATILSVKQIDYALSNNGIVGGNKIFELNRVLSDGGALDYPEKLMLERLGAYSNTWDDENEDEILNASEILPNVIFDRSKALFEVNDSIYISDINSDPSDTELISEMTTALKRIVYNNGGATVNIKTSDYNLIRNILNENDYLTITNTTYYSMPSTQHALHIIGWDDNYEYAFCSGDYGGLKGKFVSDNALYTNDHSCGQYEASGTTKNYVKVTGRGAWILKNSWGNYYSYIYLPYDSLIDGFYTISSYSEKNWDDSHILKGKGIYDYGTRTWRYVYNVDSDLFDGDTAVKLKIKSNNPKTISLYFSEDGSTSNLVFIGNYTFDYAGVKTIDLQGRNLKIKKESVFQIDDPNNRLMLFTSKKDSTAKAVTSDVTYNISNSNVSTYNVPIATKLKNVSDNTTVNYKIKKSNGDYLSTSSYTITLNKAYYNMVTPTIMINSSSIVAGTYTLETLVNNNLLYSSSLVLVDGQSVDEEMYILTLDYNYNNLVDRSRTITTNSPYGNLPTLTRDGYTFLGWYTERNGGTKIESTTIFTGTSNTTIYAHWQIKSYTVTFNSNGGSSVTSQTVNYNGKVTKPTNPTRTGYTFKEWQLNGKAYDFNTAVTSDITLTATWQIKSYTVTFNSNGGSSVASQTVNYNGKATRPANPTRTGYIFKEWQLNGKAYDFNTAVTSNITLTAIWQIKNEELTSYTLKELLIMNGYKVIDSYTTNFALGESISSIKNKLGNNVVIESKTDIISTGTIIRDDVDSYTVYIKGDLTGDGKVNSADLLIMRKHLLEDPTLTGAYKQAGIIESSNDIKSLDLLRLRQYLLGEYTFK